jgi:hypothetical protein
MARKIIGWIGKARRILRRSGRFLDFPSNPGIVH